MHIDCDFGDLSLMVLKLLLSSEWLDPSSLSCRLGLCLVVYYIMYTEAHLHHFCLLTQFFASLVAFDCLRGLRIIRNSGFFVLQVIDEDTAESQSQN